jgi:hypothetical protein
LFSKFTQLRLRKDRKNPPADQVVAECFRVAIEQWSKDNDSPLAPVSGWTVQEWLSLFFGTNSTRGYTTLFPVKSDACTTCASLDGDIKAASISLLRHRQHYEDAGTIERQAAIKEIEDQIEDLWEERTRHKKLAEDAYSSYRARTGRQRALYQTLTKVCAQFLHHTKIFYTIPRFSTPYQVFWYGVENLGMV